MYALARLQKAFADAVARRTGLPAAEVLTQIALPDDPARGEVAFPCFALAKRERKAPPAIAADLASMSPPAGFAKLEAAGGYLNGHADRAALAREVVGEIGGRGEAYGDTDEDVGKTVLVEFSSPNVGKAFGIHHLRSTMIGHSLSRILTTRGSRVVRLNYLGDWGTQFGSLIAASEKWPDAFGSGAVSFRGVMDAYARFHREVETDPSLEGVARAAFRRLEDGDAVARAVWERVREANLAEFERIYDLLGVAFDETSGESSYGKRADDLVRWLEGRGLLKESEGALVVAFDDHPEWPPLIVRKSDGATKYETRDLAAARDRFERHRFDRLIYVVDVAQTLHFRMLFDVLRRAKCDWAQRCEHVVFGRYQGMSTRKGTFVLLEEVLERAVALADEKLRSAIAEGLVSIPEPQIPVAARAVGIGAVVFNDLKTRRIKDVTFDWDDLMNFHGRTGPYLQYAHARIAGILRKAGGEASTDIPPPDTLAPDEHALVVHLARFPLDVAHAARDAEPSFVATSLLDLATVFSRFYESCPVLNSEPIVRAWRLALVHATGTVLRRGLYLLGLEAPEKM